MVKRLKPKILLCWGYNRKGWVEVFEQLKDQFEFVYLFHIEKQQDKVKFTDCEVIYWSSYKSAYQLLKIIKPHKIVFMSIDGVNSLTLNVVAKKKGIPTIVMQHGLFHSLEFYVKLQKEEQKNRLESNANAVQLSSENTNFLLLFFLRSLRVSDVGFLFFLIKWQLKKRKMVEQLALKQSQSSYRLADDYIVYTKYNASIYRERDGVDEERLIPVGNPEITKFLSFKEANDALNSNYFLLIDQPFAEVKDFGSNGFGINKTQVNEFYLKLNQFALKHNARLKIKLHPYSYESDFFVLHENIDYIRDAEIVPLLMRSTIVFGFFSSLILPALYFKKCCIFQIWEESDFQKSVAELDLAVVFNYFNFTAQDLQSVIKWDKNIEKLNKLVDRYFLKMDGKTLERIANKFKD